MAILHCARLRRLASRPDCVATRPLAQSADTPRPSQGELRARGDLAPRGPPSWGGRARSGACGVARRPATRQHVTRRSCLADLVRPSPLPRAPARLPPRTSPPSPPPAGPPQLLESHRCHRRPTPTPSGCWCCCRCRRCRCHHCRRCHLCRLCPAGNCCRCRQWATRSPASRRRRSCC